MEIKLKYYAILTIDTYQKEITIRSIKPKIVRRPKFWVTEDTPEDSYVKKHRKYCGILSPQEMSEFLYKEFSSAEDTMGAITEYGLTPAVSFNDNVDGYRTNAYVFPILDEMDELAFLRDIENHPQKEAVIELVRNEMDGVMKELREFDWYDDVKILPEKFFIDTKQLFLT